MAHQATSGGYFSESATFGTSEPFAPHDGPTTPLPETDLGQLAAKFAAPTGAGLSPDLAVDLALQMVLHEIVEQACASSAATGAAIALYHDDELVCRASYGSTAPQLGSRLDLREGLSAECLRTGQIQLCNDVQTDLRVDLEVCSQWGVRSIIVLPLSRDQQVRGIFEIFSPRPSAFGESEIAALQAFAERILKNLDRCIELSSAMTVENPPSPNVTESSQLDANEVADQQPSETDEVRPGHTWTETATWALGVVVLACASWLGVRLFQNLNREPAAQRAASKVDSPSTAMNNPAIASSSSNSAARSQPTPSSTALPQRIDVPRSTPAKPRVPAGSLLVYENGREVFRLPPSSPDAEAPGISIEKAAAVQPQSIVEIPSSTAESNLIHRVEPEYPEEARLGGIQGQVVLKVHISPDGSVQQCKLMSGEPVLANAAMTAVKQWRFKPHRVKGKPAEMQTTITLNFRLPS
jgi:TonB family protein